MKKISLKSFDILKILALAVFLTMLLLSCLTPMLADDFSYCFSWVDDRRIAGLGDIIESLAAHRNVTNGRMFSHFLAHMFLMWPKMIFNVANALNCVLLMYLARKVFGAGDQCRDALLLCAGLFMLWCFMPVFGQVFLWLDGALNYSWGISLMLIFLLPYVKLFVDGELHFSAPAAVLYMLLAFVVGAYSENGSLATMFAAFCLLALSVIRDKKLPLLPAAALAVAALGFVFLMSAPAVSGRAGEFSISAIANSLKTIIQMSKKELLLPFCLYFALLALSIGRVELKKIVLSAVLFLAGLGSLACFIFAVYFADRHFCFTVFFTVFASLVLMAELYDAGLKDACKALTAVLAAMFIFEFVYGALDVLVMYKAASEREAAIVAAVEAGETSVYVPVYEPASKYSATYKLDDLSDSDSAMWPNCSIAIYYGIDEIYGIYP